MSSERKLKLGDTVRLRNGNIQVVTELTNDKYFPVVLNDKSLRKITGEYLPNDNIDDSDIVEILNLTRNPNSQEYLFNSPLNIKVASQVSDALVSVGYSETQASLIFDKLTDALAGLSASDLVGLLILKNFKND